MPVSIASVFNRQVSPDVAPNPAADDRDAVSYLSLGAITLFVNFSVNLDTFYLKSCKSGNIAH
jgi:hypothetical protein